MKIGFWPTDRVMPAIGCRRSRISFSSSFCERRFFTLTSVSLRSTRAVLRPSWVPTTAYTVGQLVRPTNTSTTPYLFSVTVAGTSGSSEPAWPTAVNATVTNGTATFKNIGGLGLGQLSVDLPVDLTPGDTTQLYELKDSIVLRNTTR